MTHFWQARDAFLPKDGENIGQLETRGCTVAEHISSLRDLGRCSAVRDGGRIFGVRVRWRSTATPHSCAPALHTFAISLRRAR